MKHIRGISGMALAIAIATPAVAQARPAETTVLRQEQRFDIAPSDLRTAISRFSQATGVQVVVAPDAVSGRRTAGVRGSYTVRTALDHLLRGTNLGVTFQGGVAILKPMAAAPVHPALVKVAAQDSALSGAAMPDRSVGEGTDIIVTGYRHSLTEAQSPVAPRGRQ